MLSVQEIVDRARKIPPSCEIPYVYDDDLRDMSRIANTKGSLHLALYMTAKRYDVNQHMYKQLMKDDPIIVAATSQGYYNLVRCLVELGADVNDRGTGTYKTAIFHAIGKNDTDLVKFLLEAGANPRISDIDGNSSYLIAKQRKSTQMLEIFDKWIEENPIGRC